MMASDDSSGRRSLVASIATYRRPAELARLLRSLREGAAPPDFVVIGDNAAQPETSEIARAEFGEASVVLSLPENRGPGDAWRRAAEAGLERVPGADVLYLDDDVVMPPGALAAMRTVLHQHNAGAVAPLLEDGGGLLWAFPEPEEKPLRRVIRECRRPADLLAKIGPEPRRFCWCTGACVLVGSRAMAGCGLHRSDFFMLGEDLEYGMRLSARFPCYYLPGVSVPHLPPEPKDAAASVRGDRIKFLSLLQNLSYLAFRHPDSRHMRSYLPGNFRRWFRTHGWTARNGQAAVAAFVAGAVQGEPAGMALGQGLRGRFV